MVPTAQDLLDHGLHGPIQRLGVCLVRRGGGPLSRFPDPRKDQPFIHDGIPPEGAAAAVCVVIGADGAAPSIKAR